LRGKPSREITAFSVEENLKAGVFRFAPPLIDRAPDPKALYLMARAFQFVFDDIADPRAFPPLPAPHPEADLAIYRRYIEAAEELAESQLLCGSDNVTIRFDSTTGIEEVEGTFTSKEITRGFAVLLRQFDSKDEPASFQRVSGRLRNASKAATDGRSDERCQQIDAWRKAQGALHGTELQRLTRRKLDPALEYGNEHPPTYYLSAYNYGELIHWDSGRGAGHSTRSGHNASRRVSLAEFGEPRVRRFLALDGRAEPSPAVGRELGQHCREICLVVIAGILRLVEQRDLGNEIRDLSSTEARSLERKRDPRVPPEQPPLTIGLHQQKLELPRAIRVGPCPETVQRELEPLAVPGRQGSSVCDVELPVGKVPPQPHLIIPEHDDVEVAVRPRRSAQEQIERPAAAHPPGPLVATHQPRCVGRNERLPLH